MVKYKKGGKILDKDIKTKVLTDEDIDDDDDACDLDPNKICDSCGKCIEPDKNYQVIKITKIIED